MSERDVVFKLTASADPKAAQAAKEFEATLLASQKKVFAGQEKFDKERVRIGKEANQALRQFAEENRDAILKDAEVIKSFTIRIAQVTARELNRIDAEQIAAERVAHEQAVAKQVASQEAKNRAVAASNRRAQREEIAAIKAMAAERETYDKAIAKNNTQFSQASRNMREQFAELGESVMRVGRGFTLLGLAGESDILKIQQGLLKAQAAFDLFSGGLKIINKLERAWAAYLVMIEAANTAMAIHNALALKGAVSGAVGSAVKSGIGAAAGGAVGQVAGQAAARGLSSTGQAVAIGAGSVVGGGATVAATNKAIQESVAKATATWWSRVNPMALLGQAPKIAANPATGIAREVVAGTGLRGAIGNAASRLPLWMTTANAGASLGVAGRGASLLGRVNPFVGAALAVPNLVRAGYETKGWWNDVANRNASSKNLARMQENAPSVVAGIQAHHKQTGESIVDTVKEQYDIVKKIEDAKLRMAETDQEKWSVLSKSMISGQARINALRKEASQTMEHELPLRKNLTRLAEEEQNHLKQLAKERSDIESSIAQTRVTSAKAAMDASRKELDTVTSRIKAEQDALKTAEERFGLMSRDDQKEVMGLLMKARAGKQLDASQVSKLKSLGTTEAERLASQQARNLANGDYSAESRSINSIAEANRRLRSGVLDITDGKTNRYGVNPGAPRMLSKRQKEEIESKQYMIEANERRAEQISLAAARDTAMRRSIFGEERSALSASLGQKQSIEAKISQQLTIVAKFENTAQQMAEIAVRQLVAAQAPWMAEFERRLNTTMVDLGNLQKQRRQTAPGRS